jgi:hypothetical protein
LAAAFPLYTGALVRGPRQGFPSEHVALPGYWTAMASFANAEPRQQAILVLPTDDFYQMPYRWYYGSDGFIPNLFSAHVVDPVGQGYTPASAELLAASRLVQRSLLSHNWRLAGRLLAALDTRQILVRGDIEYPFRKRKFVSPAALMAALARMPGARLLRREGPLQLWTIQRPAPRLPFATVNSNTPKLRSLALLPGGTPLVSSTPVQGHPSVWQLPPIASWTRRGATLVMAAKVGAAWSWHVAVLGGRLPPRTIGRAPVRLGPGLTAAASRSARDTLTVNFRDTTGASLLSDGNFRRSWGPVGDCNDQLLSAAARGLVGARVGQVSGIRSSRAVTLRAVADSACVSHALRWRRGPLLLSAEVRHLSGNQPRVCVWELGPKRCAPIVQPTSTSRWSHYQAVVKPSRGTTGLKLFLYADAPALGGTTVNQYAGIQAVSLDTAPSLVLVGTPRARPARERLVTSPYSYLSVWRARGRHVVVDGLRNGWLVSPNTKTTPRYAPARIISIAQIVALCFTLVTLTGVALLTLTDRARPRRQTRVGVPR